VNEDRNNGVARPQKLFGYMSAQTGSEDVRTLARDAIRNFVFPFRARWFLLKVQPSNKTVPENDPLETWTLGAGVVGKSRQES